MKELKPHLWELLDLPTLQRSVDNRGRVSMLKIRTDSKQVWITDTGLVTIMGLVHGTWLELDRYKLGPKPPNLFGASHGLRLERGRVNPSQAKRP